MFQHRSGTDVDADRRGWPSVTFLLGAVLLCYYLVPLVALLVSQPPGVVLRRLTSPDVLSAASTSISTALASTGLSTAFGVPLAFWLTRTDGRLGTAVTALVVLPLVLPPVVSGMLLLTVVGPNTLLGDIAAAGGVPLTRSVVGVVLAQTFVASPFVVITARAAFDGVDPQLGYASRSLGVARLATLRRVVLPLAWPGILAGITLAFARAIGEFGATLMVAYYPRTMPVEIWVSFSTQGLDRAFPIAVILVGVAVATLVVLNVLGADLLD